MNRIPKIGDSPIAPTAKLGIGFPWFNYDKMKKVKLDYAKKFPTTAKRKNLKISVKYLRTTFTEQYKLEAKYLAEAYDREWKNEQKEKKERLLEKQANTRRAVENWKKLLNEHKEELLKRRKIAEQFFETKNELEIAARREFINCLIEDSDLWELHPNELRNKPYHTFYPGEPFLNGEN
eukprot:TRINITY_DN651_c0_g1_i1.p1 TRINITY_DN651_c0_g1~~TRINITY_DN651_c0_g1_i1.p1  ORF type:complete len:200 (-),score=100.56 TRINITY_DN651_c0_g1_i1:73-609(-)